MLKRIFIYVVFFFLLSSVCEDKLFANQVPSPWIPIKIENIQNQIKLQVWGRDYIFDGTSLLKKIKINGDEVLDQPIHFAINGTTSWRPVSLRVIQKNPQEVILETNSVCTYKSATITMESTVSIYYDGLIFFKNQLTSTSNLDVDLSLNILLKNDISQYINRFSYVTPADKRTWKSDKFTNDNTSYIPYWWIGNGDKGLFFFAESPHNWQNYRDHNAIAFTNVDGKAAVKASLIQKGYKKKSWYFEFGLQATPVKPIDGRWRKQQLIGAKTSNIHVVWPDAGQPYQLKYFGYPEPKSPIEFRKHLDKINKNKTILVYNSLNYMAADAPEWNANPSWNAGVHDYSSDVKAYKGAGFVQANISDSKFQEFVIDKSREFIKKYEFDGYYLDYSMLMNLNSTRNIKKFDNGITHLPYYPIMELRKYYEKFYTMLKNEGKDNFLVMHVSARIVPPLLQFADMYVNGEQFRQDATRVNDDYLKVTNLEAFRTEFSGKPYGIPGVFLPAFTSKNYNIIEPTRYLASILMQHDIGVWPIYSTTVVWNERFRLLNEFPNIQNSEFIPYYHNQPLLKSSDRNLLVSVYKNPNGDLMGIVSNLSDIQRSSVITSVFTQRLFADYKLVKKNIRGKIDASENAVQITVPSKDYIVFYLLKK